MASRTVAAHLDPKTLAAFKVLLETENRSPSQVLSVSLKSFLDYSPGAKRALFAIDGMSSEAEREFAAKVIGRAILRAYEGILSTRRTAEAGKTIGNETMLDEDAIEAEAVRICSG